MSSRITDFESQTLEFCIILDCPEDSKYSIDYISGVAAIGASGKFCFDLRKIAPELHHYSNAPKRRSAGWTGRRVLRRRFGLSMVTETLYGHSFSASSISAINKPLDARLQAFAERQLNAS